jgi:hypothetical protein
MCCPANPITNRLEICLRMVGIQSGITNYQRGCGNEKIYLKNAAAVNCWPNAAAAAHFNLRQLIKNHL